jgi:hypothetical protein
LVCACFLLVAFGILFDPEDGGSTLLRNVGTLLSGYTAPVEVYSIVRTIFCSHTIACIISVSLLVHVLNTYFNFVICAVYNGKF